MTLANGRPYLAIPGPSVMPDRVLQAMHRPAPNIYEGALEETVAGMIKMTPEWGELPPRWMVYFQVAACPATMTKTEALGGKVLYGPLEAAGLGRFAVLQDPQGVAFSVIETYDDDAPAG